MNPHNFWEEPAEEWSDAERRARAMWSYIAEPTDPAARLLWYALGPQAALQLVLEASSRRIANVLAEARDLPEASALAVTSAQQAPTMAQPLAVAERARSLWLTRMEQADNRLIEHSQMLGIRMALPGQKAWLRTMGDLGINAPLVLWYKGAHDAAICSRVGVAMVGCRAATGYGKDLAFEWAYSVAQRGICVVSGGAFGIDAAAHHGALRAREDTEPRRWGGTIAFLAGGLDDYYPRANAQLLSSVASYGALYSEAPLGARPTRWRFLARNRLIAAATCTTLVVEAAYRSGALSTAAHADALSRHVAAVPGSIRSATSGGCHRLIQERGAQLVTSPQELMETLGGASPAHSQATAQLVGDEELLDSKDRLIFDGVPAYSTIALKDLAAECAVTESEAMLALERIELLGLVKRTGQMVRRAT